MLVRCIAILLSAALAFPVAAQTLLPALGGRGGGPFEARCPAGIMRGVELLTGDDVNGIRPICAGADEGIGPWRGSSGGRNQRLLCPPDRPAVTAMTVAAEGLNTVIVNTVDIWCGPATGGSGTRSDAGWTGPRVGGGGTWPFNARFAETIRAQTYRCPAGQAGIGLHGRHGIWLDSLGLICATVAPPPSGRPLPARHIAGPPKTPIEICQAARKAQGYPNLPANTKALLVTRCVTGYPGDGANSRNPCVRAKFKYAAGQPFGTELAQCFASLPRD